MPPRTREREKKKQGGIGPLYREGRRELHHMCAIKQACVQEEVRRSEDWKTGLDGRHAKRVNKRNFPSRCVSLLRQEEDKWMPGRACVVRELQARGAAIACHQQEIRQAKRGRAQEAGKSVGKGDTKMGATRQAIRKLCCPHTARQLEGLRAGPEEQEQKTFPRGTWGSQVVQSRSFRKRVEYLGQMHAKSGKGRNRH